MSDGEAIFNTEEFTAAFLSNIGIDMDKQYHNYLNHMGNPMTYSDLYII